MNEVHVEAGYKLNGSLLRERPRRRAPRLSRAASSSATRRTACSTCRSSTDLAEQPRARACATCARVGDDIRIAREGEALMFTGIIAAVGRIAEVAPSAGRACGCASTRAALPLDDVALGDSIAVERRVPHGRRAATPTRSKSTSRSETLACVAGFDARRAGQSRKSAAPLRPARRPPRERPRRRRRHGRALRAGRRQPAARDLGAAGARALHRAQGLGRGRRREPHRERRRGCELFGQPDPAHARAHQLRALAPGRASTSRSICSRATSSESCWPRMRSKAGKQATRSCRRSTMLRQSP